MLREHECSLPPPPPLPTARVENGTAEGVANLLRFTWPSVAWASNEGATVTAGHGFSEDALMRTMAFLNQRWDGSSMDRARSAEDHSKVHGRRLSVSLMMQPHAFRHLVNAGDGAARGLGLLARFLVCWPRSTMGTRFRDPDSPEPELAALARFNDRAEELYRLPLPMPYDVETMTPATDARGNPVADPLKLSPRELPLSGEAHRLWLAYLNACEAELAPHGELCDVADVAAKSAENAARLAGIFHVWSHGPEGEISGAEMASGVRVARWFLYEARRVLGLSDENEAASDALVLAQWVRAREAPPTLSEVAQIGPCCVRGKKRRDAALALLCTKHWMRREKRDGSTVLLLNPNLRWE
jgi:putative DNA primase/helicase